MKRLFDHLPRILASLIVVFLFITYIFDLLPAPLIDRLELQAYDLRLRSTLTNQTDDRIVIVDIDEQSLQQKGQWPWSRTIIQQLIDNLVNHYGASLVAFDVVFAEKEQSDVLQELSTLAKNDQDEEFRHKLQTYGATINFDKKLADTLSTVPVVLGYYFHISENISTFYGRLPEPVFEDDGFIAGTIAAPRATGYGANLPVLQQAAEVAGFFSNPSVDADGAMRRAPMLHEFDGALYASLSLAVLMHYTNEIPIPDLVEIPGTDDLLMRQIEIGEYKIPLNPDGSIFIPFIGKKGSFPYISAIDVLRQDQGIGESLKNKIVFVGTSARVYRICG